MRNRIAPVVLMALLGRDTQATRIYNKKSAILAQQDAETEVEPEEVP
jgi:hypothetical protein